MPEPRFVVFHQPGPAWQSGLPIFQQPGVQAHVEHYRQLLLDGKLSQGGPFLDAQGGGMMIAEPGTDAAALTAFAQADPAVTAGLLTVQVRPWLVGLQK